MMGHSWDPDEAIDTLKLERSMDESEAATAQRIFVENLPAAAQSIAHTAIYSTNERLRLDAAKYVVERVMGRVKDVDPMGNVDPFAELLASCVNSVGPVE